MDSGLQTQNYEPRTTVVVRFENIVIVSESQRDESNYESLDALAPLTCLGLRLRRG